MKPRQIERIGKILFRDNRWKSAMARELGLDRTTIYRWLNGDYEMKEEYRAALITAIKDKQQDISTLLYDLDES